MSDFPPNVSENKPDESKKTQPKSRSYLEKYADFLNLKTGTILTAAIGMAVGFALKDLISSAINNVLQPLIISMLTLIHLNNFDKFISPQIKIINFSTFVSSLLTFVFTIVTVYYSNILISTTL